MRIYNLFEYYKNQISSKKHASEKDNPETNTLKATKKVTSPKKKTSLRRVVKKNINKGATKKQSFKRKLTPSKRRSDNSKKTTKKRKVKKSKKARNGFDYIDNVISR